MNEELPFLAHLCQLARHDPTEADALYRDFLEVRARAGGVGDGLIAGLLGRAFRSMNLAGIAQAIATARFAPSVE